jgi:hypothetical protein
MMHIDIVITNPNHHVLITLPIARELQKQGISVRYISLCEVRKFKTPVKLFEDTKIRFEYFDIKLPQGKAVESKKANRLQKIKSLLLREVFWISVLRPKISKWLLNTTHIVVLNDTAYPSNYILKSAKRKSIISILLQEGIRFPLPVEKINNYGSTGVDYLITWGQKSVDYFKNVTHHKTNILGLGSPGFDKSLFIQQSLDSIPQQIKRIAIFGNPIDDQAFVSSEEKIALYIDLARTLMDYSATYNRELEIVFKNHPRESPEMLRSILKKNGLRHIKVYESNSDVDIVINSVDAGIVFASTVGINVILHGKKLAVVKLKHHDYLGDYVQDNVAYGLNIYEPIIKNQLDDFLSSEHYFFRNYRSYLEHFAANAGTSDKVIAKFIQGLE